MKLSLKTAAFGILLSGLLLTSRPTHAQDFNPPVMFENFAGNMAMDRLLFDNTTGQIGRYRRGRRGTATKGVAPVSAVASLSYVPTPALRAQKVRGYVDRLKTKNPAAAQAMAANFGPGQRDYGQIYRGITQGTGLRENDAADNLSALTILGWMIVNNVQQVSALPAGSPQGVRAQLAPKLAQNAQLTAPGVPAKLGEEVKLLFVLTQSGWQAALKEGALPAYQQSVATMFQKQYGLDMNQVKLTPQGFVKR